MLQAFFSGEYIIFHAYLYQAYSLFISVGCPVRRYFPNERVPILTVYTLAWAINDYAKSRGLFPMAWL